MRRFAILTGLAAIAVAGFAAPQTARADCTCKKKHPIAVPPREAAAVFKGTPISKNDGAEGEAVYRFKVDRYWKGWSVDQIEVTAAGGECGREYDVGQTYLVFATAPQGNLLRDDACTHTAKIEDSHDALARLGFGRKPSTAVPTTPGKQGRCSVVADAPVPGWALLVLALGFVRRRR